MASAWRRIADRHDCFRRTRGCLSAALCFKRDKGFSKRSCQTTGHPCGIGTGQVVLCLEKAVEQGTVHHLMRFVHPDGLEELVLEVRIIGLQSIDPFLNGGKGLGFRQVHQAQLGQNACGVRDRPIARTIDRRSSWPRAVAYGAAAPWR